VADVGCPAQDVGAFRYRERNHGVGKGGIVCSANTATIRFAVRGLGRQKSNAALAKRGFDVGRVLRASVAVLQRVIVKATSIDDATVLTPRASRPSEPAEAGSGAALLGRNGRGSAKTFIRAQPYRR
jgi:hypothetical protein